ncbi:MAG TPA: hypothetical protein DDW73_24160 [Rhizobium sp.]|jgi:hypothetical protein|nr:hypothetical protein [Rhizobium sp.]
MMDILRDVAMAFSHTFVWISFLICAVIIIWQFSINSHLRTQLHDLRELTAIANGALEYAGRCGDGHDGARHFLWCFRFSPAELETRFPSWPVFRNRFVEKAMRARS